MASIEIERLVRFLGRLPGLGPRSAQRVALALMKRPDTLLRPLADALTLCADRVRTCGVCGNLDAVDPCAVCRDPERDRGTICVVQEVDDLWALERSGTYRGLYHVLGGTLSALDGRGPEELRIAGLLARAEAAKAEGVALEVVLALGVTVEGQTTGHYLAERLTPFGCAVSRLAQGVPVGGEMNYLDEGTIEAALRARQRIV
ncbi:MAG: recombination protein RecR [Geminicoccaceae bacterium]|nr:recombination protein RecR [Geminicoccaceae bacterium]